jgi:hypothetical protein
MVEERHKDTLSKLAQAGISMGNRPLITGNGVRSLTQEYSSINIFTPYNPLPSIEELKAISRKYQKNYSKK